MSFTLDRSEAARILSVSTRTIDRHIQSEHIRVKRVGKKIWLESNDVEALRDRDTARMKEDYEVVTQKDIPEELKSEIHTILPISEKQSENTVNLVRLYENACQIIEKKDELIQDLSYKLGKTENELKNSISLSEYKKATFLLESAIQKWETDANTLSQRVAVLETDVNRRNGVIFGLAILSSMIIIFSIIFFLYIKIGIPF